MPEYLPVFVVGFALLILMVIAYLVAYLWPEPGPRRTDRTVR
ncbi:hypothetical protein AB0M45_18105 [Nocardia sp. NPDC051787]